MASSPPSSVKSEPVGALSSAHDPNLSYTSAFDTSIETTLPISAEPMPTTTSSIFIDPPASPSGEGPFDHLQGFSAPTLPVYINMGVHDTADDVTFAGATGVTSASVTTGILMSRSLAAIDVDRPIPAVPLQRHSHHHPHHFPHHAQNRNRYPYLQRPSTSRGLHRSQGAPTSMDGGLTYLEQRPAFRRSYFALRRQRIPKAPPMPKHLYPGYKQTRTAASATGRNAEGQQNTEEGEEEDEDQPPRKSLWVILRLVFFFFAIEFMYAVETALTVPILTSLRVPESFYSMAWLISPILGFFLQPIVGMWSDTCKCRWGRRRPFILAFAIGAYIGVTLLLNSSDLGVLLGDPTEPGTIPFKAIVLTAVGVTLLDFCADSADAPIRAYLIDTTNPSDQERGFNIHAILGGFGGGLGFIVGAIHWPYIPIFDGNGGEFTVIYLVASFLFVFCTLSTLTSVREEPLISSNRVDNDTSTSNDEESNELDFDEKRPLLSSRRHSARSYTNSQKASRSSAPSYLNDLNDREGFTEIDPATGTRIPHDYVERASENILLQTLERSHQLVAASMANADPSNSAPVPAQAFEAELKQKAKLVKLGLMRRPASENNKEENDESDNVTLKSMLISMVRMPPRLWKLMICQVIGWIAYFATHLYFTDYMATTVYHGTFESGDDDDTEGFDLYKKGVTMGCWGLFVYSASSAAYAFCLERWLAERFSLTTMYFLGYFVYALGCIVNYYVHNVVVNIIMCVTFGMLVVSLNTLPYHMLSNFHADETYKNKDGSKRGIGVDCSLLNSCYFLGELVVAVGLGPLLDRTGVNTCMLIGAVFALIGNLSMSFLFYFTK